MNMSHVITLIADPAQKKLSAEMVEEVRSFVVGEGLQVGEADWLSEGEACDIPVSGNIAVPPITGVDVIVQPAANRRKKLLITDMDSTIITVECIDELADMVGLKEQVSEITERAMNGELDFKQALVERVSLLKGLKEEALSQVYDERIRFMPGARELVATMRENGAHCLLVSGGFTYFTSRVKQALGFHGENANILEMEDGALTGTVTLPILDKDSKKQALELACKELGVSKDEAIAIGDGANDLPMLLAAGLGIAYHAKPSVRAAAKAWLDVANLRGALFAQGYRAEEFKS